MKISLLLPVYNVEKYLRYCLDSCVYQENVELNKDYEVICINDGSTDGSSAILDEYVENYGVRVYNYENAGVSIARNRGLDNARGEYIWWIDSDDYIASDSVKHLIEATNKYPSDFYRFNWEKVQEGENKITTCGELKLCSSADWNNNRADNYVWSYLMKRKSVINHNLTFVGGVILEDNIWQTCFWAKGLQSLYFKNRLYFYRCRPGSITRKRNSDLYMESMMKMQDVYGELLRNNSVIPSRRDQLELMYRRQTGNILWAELTLQKYKAKELLDSYRIKGLYPYPIQWKTIIGGARIGWHTLIIDSIKLLFPIEGYYRFVHFLFSLKYKKTA